MLLGSRSKLPRVRSAANFVWGLPEGFDTQGEDIYIVASPLILLGFTVGRLSFKWWPTPASRYCPGALEETCDLGAWRRQVPWTLPQNVAWVFPRYAIQADPITLVGK
jgi:hypothetical protein